MALSGFVELFEGADRRGSPVPVAVAGGHDATVLDALQIATRRGWIRPIVVGNRGQIESIASERGIATDEFRVIDVGDDPVDVASAAVGEVRDGRALALMKGQIATPALMSAVLDPRMGLRTGRAVCQVVLMEIPRDGRRFLLADTGITVKPSFAQSLDILKGAVEVARALGEPIPRVAVLAATESVKDTMPETITAAGLTRRNQDGEIPGCLVQGPLSFDLAYAVDAGEKKRIGGQVVGAADVMLFPDLLSANLTVKAIMYTADCQFGGILRGTSSPVVFMSRADSTETRLRSIALTLLILDHAGSD